MAIIAIVDMYSGRPNPSWELNEPQVEEFRRMLESSRATEPPSGQPFDGLGYRGVQILNRDREADLPYRVDATGGFLRIIERPGDEASAVHTHSDEQGIERWVLEQAEARDLGRSIERMGGPRFGAARN